MVRGCAWAWLLAVVLLLSACGAREAAVSPAPESAPAPELSTPEPVPEPVCILAGEEIASLCDTAFSYDAMLTADGKLLAWREIPFDWEKCVLRQDNGGYLDVYELPLERVTGAWLGRDSILALDQEGVLWGLGSNTHGQLWNAADYEGWDAPVKLTDHVVSAAMEGWGYSAAVKDDGGVWLMGRELTGEPRLSPTKIAEIEGAEEIYAGNFLYVRDRDGVSWRLGEVDELLDDPTALMGGQDSGIRWWKDDLWLTDGGELVRGLSNGEERTLLTDVADVDLAYDIYATAVTKGGDLYVWNEAGAEEDSALIVDTPTKVMEGVKLAGAWEHGVVVVTQADGGVWVLYGGTVNAALAEGRLIELPG